MEKTLHFIALYNSQIIQVGFGIVLLLIMVYIYRIFFMSSVTDSSGTEKFNAENLEEKLDLIIEQQKQQQQPLSGSLLAAARGSEEGATPEEVDKLKSEIYNLRQQLVESEKNLSDLKLNASTASTASKESNTSNTTQASNTKMESTQDSVKMAQLEALIVDLQGRLSEYEIIADDIAELSQLRTENAKLIQELAALKASGTVSSPVVKETENSITEPVQQSKDETMIGSPQVSAQEKNSIDDFEKNVLKKENE